MNCSNCCVLPDDIMTSLMPPMLALEFVFGVLGNGLALWIFCFYLKPWKSSQIYLFNLAMADFLLISSLPFRTYMYWNKWDWQIGPISCSATLFMLGMNRQGSTIFLTVVAVDRYFRVVHPHHALNRISNWTAAIVSCVLWGVTISLNCHLLKVKLRPCLNNKSICSSFVTCNTSVWHDAMFFFQFFLPLAIMLFCSARIIWTLRQRHMDKDVKIKRAIRFMLVVTTVFIICFLPCVAMRIGIFILLNTGEIKDCSYYHSMHQAFFLTLSFTYMNSILDPLVYYFSSPSFSNFFSIMINRCRQKTSPQQTGCFSSQQDTLVYRLCSPAFSMINCCLRKKPPGEPSANQRRSMEATEDGSTTKSAVEIHGYLSSELWSSSPSVSLNKPAQQD